MKALKFTLKGRGRFSERLACAVPSIPPGPRLCWSLWTCSVHNHLSLIAGPVLRRCMASMMSACASMGR